ncbi:MAG: ATP-binding protein [Candidatus Izemoplasmatales bacterium]|nr:ATP-binding protein [Candidatus Izemoplasmatales bacterium]
MKRKISFEFIILIFSALVAFTIGATFFARSSINNVTELNLEKYLEIIKIDYEDLTSNEIIDKYSGLDNYLRITFIDAQGEVTADSSADDLDNHLDRPEIANIGESYIRHSDTLNIDMMYLASVLEDGSYLRVAIPITSILGFLNDFIALSIVIGIIIIFLSIMSSSYLIRQSLKPLSDTKIILENINKGEYQEILPIIKYDEINGLIQEINQINKTISDNIASLKSEKQKSDFLLNHMNQGICVLDEEARIVLLNNYLKNLYNFNINYNINKDYRYLFRDEDIQKAIKKAYDDKENSTLIAHIEEKYYSISIIYSDKDWSFNSSVILIYSDITSAKNIEILKRDFFVNASHELKSPLTTIIGSVDLISQGMAKDKETVNDLIERIASEAKRMNNLVMDMLTLSEYETKNQNSQKQVINMQSLIQELVENLSVLASNNKISISSKVEDFNIFVNYEEIYQLLKNLVENAIKYGKVDGNVWINVEQDELYLIIKIKDDGIGIPKTDLNRVFERFYRVDKARSRSAGGTGLGLSIVKHIVLNYDGHVDISSEEDDGTEVSVYLPKKELNIL